MGKIPPTSKPRRSSAAHMTQHADSGNPSSGAQNRYKNHMPKPRLNINWESQPWSTRNDMQLARALGCSNTTVKKHREQHAPDTKTPRGRSAIDLSGADFTQHNLDIAEAFGCDSSTVRYWRLHHDVPASTAPRRPGSGRPIEYDRSKFRPTRSAADNARDMGCPYQLAWWLLKQHKQKGTITPDERPNAAGEATASDSRRSLKSQSKLEKHEYDNPPH